MVSEMNKQEILKQYSQKEDKIFISSLLEKREQANKKNQIVSTDFLDGYQIKITQQLLKKEKIVNHIFWGGYENAQRKLAIFYPEKLIEKETLWKKQKTEQIKVLRFTLPKSIEKHYTHPIYLGGIVKLGIKREKIGDILVDLNTADILLRPEIVSFVKQEVRQLKRFQKAKIEEISMEDLKIIEPKTEKQTIVVASLRLDAVIAGLIHVSRKEASQIIAAQRVYLNYERIEKEKKEIKIGDLLTIRGKGRFSIIEQVRTTQKDRIVLSVEKNIS